jgi:hypothetical protein
MAARNPAPPAPITRTSYSKASYSGMEWLNRYSVSGAAVLKLLFTSNLVCFNASRFIG